MARKRYSDEDILKLLREIGVKLSAGSDVQSACRGVAWVSARRRITTDGNGLAGWGSRSCRRCAL